jgi:hypothetical protein
MRDTRLNNVIPFVTALYRFALFMKAIKIQNTWRPYDTMPSNKPPQGLLFFIYIEKLNFIK